MYRKHIYVIIIVLFTVLIGLFIAFENRFKTPIQRIEQKSTEIITNRVKQLFAFPETAYYEAITSLTGVFNSIDSSFEVEPSESTISIISTGDIMLGRTVNYKTLTYKDFTWAFKNIADLLKSADVTFVNLENPLTENCPTKNEGMLFCAPNDHVKGLLYGGIDIASLANNHAFNYAKNGINNTEKILNESNIQVTGLNNLIVKEVAGADGTPKGLKISFLGYTDVECYIEYTSCLERDKLIAEITDAKKQTDLVVVMFHWGTEYTHQPTKRQKEFAHTAIDNGADLVLGNHPHWFQPLEMYKEKLIAYSHGNTIFDQMWSEKTKEGIILKSTFDVKTKKLIDVKIYPTYIKDYGQPEILQGERKQKIINTLKKISNANLQK